TTRGSGGVKQYANSLTDMPVTCRIKVPGAGTTDAAYIALRDAWKNKTEILIFGLTYDKSTSGSEGPAGNFIVSDFSIDEGNGKVLFADVEFSPSSFNDWYV